MWIITSACNRPEIEVPEIDFTMNTAHLDHLFDTVVVNGQTVGMIHIYSEYPDYHMVDDADEGIACIDDAARAAIFYLKQYAVTKDEAYKQKGKMLMRFIMQLQDTTGYYFNFIWPDGTIHRDGITTRPGANWWTFRAFWAVGEAIDILEETNDTMLDSLRPQQLKAFERLYTYFISIPEVYDTSQGESIPTWLPEKSSAVQAAIFMCGLNKMYTQTSNEKKTEVAVVIQKMAKGILQMQRREKNDFSNGAFLSIPGHWHAYGNVQSFALLQAGALLKDSSMINGALYEIDHFYSDYYDEGGMNAFTISQINNEDSISMQKFAQIAYGVRPMIWAYLEAFKVTGDAKYLGLAARESLWFVKSNPAEAVMYDAHTGRGYDGINSAEEYNKNAGAESTIEALLAIQELQYVMENRESWLK